MTVQCAVIGVGNTILSDEGVGVHLVDRLREQWHCDPSVDFIAAETSGLQVADMMAGYGSVLLLDTIFRSSEPPGTVLVVEKKQLLQPEPPSGLAGHGLGLKKALELAEIMGVVPDNLVLVAIVPAVIDFGERLSAPVEAAMNEYESVTLALMHSMGIRTARRQGVIQHGPE